MDETTKPPVGPKNDAVTPVTREVHFSTAFVGPIPPPDILGQYESSYPGAADRIIRMAEQEAEHRRSVEQSLLRKEIERTRKDFDEARRGQVCALIITLAAILAGAYTAVKGHEIAGSIIGVGGIGSIVTTFLVGRSRGKSPADSRPRSE